MAMIKNQEGKVLTGREDRHGVNIKNTEQKYSQIHDEYLITK